AVVGPRRARCDAQITLLRQPHRTGRVRLETERGEIQNPPLAQANLSVPGPAFAATPSEAKTEHVFLTDFPGAFLRAILLGLLGKQTSSEQAQTQPGKRG